MRCSLLACLVLAALLAPAASAVTPAEIAAKVNAIRRANGIPAGIVANPDWSRKCKRHDAYMARNRVLGHEEDRSLPGYTEGGNWAGTHAVLAQGSSWADGNPWAEAPIHLVQLLAPELVSIGADETPAADGGPYGCVTTFPGYTRKLKADAIYVYPGDGVKYWPPSEVAAERPFVPGVFVGIPEGATTGPYLYALAGGPWAEGSEPVVLVSARLAGPAGPAAVRTVDARRPTVGAYLRDVGLVIPVRPLRGGATYTATVTMRGGGTTVTRTWRFATALPNAISAKLEAFDSSHGRLVVTTTAPAPRLVLDGKAVPLRREGAAYASPALALPHRFYECVRSGGGTSGYTLASECLTWTLG